MSEFKKFKKLHSDHIKNMMKYKALFVTSVPKDDLWNLYLSSFPEGTNEIYKENREYECNCCKSFIRAIGNVIAIKDNKVISIWDTPNAPYPFNIVAEEMSKLVKASPIKNVFLSNEDKLGADSNNKLGENDKVITFEHFYCELPNKFVNKTSKSVESIVGSHRSTKDVFMRSMEELTLDAGNTILELIEQGSLYKGDEFKKSITDFIKYKTKYEAIPEEEKDIWAWENSFNNPVGRIRNSAIGTLLIDISAGVELDMAVRKFESVVAPTNYKRPKEIFTKKMVEDAEKVLLEKGLTDSLPREHATLQDITVNDTLFVNRDAKKKIGGSVFDDLKTDIPENTKKLGKVEEVSIEDFVKNILPTTTSISVLMENKHQSNLMSLVAPVNKEAPSILKWNNNFSWSYNGDITDSMKQRVKEAGGNVEGVLRFSIQWNDGDNNQNDFDAHCKEPSGNTIHFSRMSNNMTSGRLDVDIQHPGNKIAVENITWTNKSKMLEGKYEFIVHNFSHNGGRTGFTAEIEYEGEIHSFSYDKELQQGEKVLVASVDVSKTSGLKFIKSLDSTMSSKEIWGIKTQKFTPVSVMSFSPNFWESGNKTGNKHYFFFMNDCINESTPRGFYNEFLHNDLMEQKRVFSALGNKMRVAQSDNQLSGLGFSSTQRNELIVKVEGNFTRTIKLKF